MSDDGPQFTTTPSAPKLGATDDRPWWKKKRFLLPIALVVLFAAAAGAGSEDTDQNASSSTTTTTAGATSSTAGESTATTKAPKRPKLEPANDPNLALLADETVKHPWANKVERMKLLAAEYGPNEGRHDVTVYLPDKSPQELAKEICESLAPIAFAQPTNAYQLAFITSGAVPDRLLYVDQGQPCSEANRAG